MAKKNSAKRATGAPELSFEQALEQLETIVRRLEDGQLPLAEALDQYEQGVGHLKMCYQLLDRAERRIELLQNVDAEGRPITEPFDETASYNNETEGTAGVRKRSKISRATPDRSGSDMDERGRLF